MKSLSVSFLTVLTLSVFTHTIYAQSTFEKYYYEFQSVGFSAISSCNDGGYLLGGLSQPGDNNTFNLVRTDSNGTIIWQKEYNTNTYYIYPQMISAVGEMVGGVITPIIMEK